MGMQTCDDSLLAQSKGAFVQDMEYNLNIKKLMAGEAHEYIKSG